MRCTGGELVAWLLTRHRCRECVRAGSKATGGGSDCCWPVSPVPGALEVHRLQPNALRDRYLVEGDGRVPMIGSSLNGLHATLAPMVLVPESVAARCRPPLTRSGRPPSGSSPR